MRVAGLTVLTALTPTVPSRGQNGPLASRLLGRNVPLPPPGPQFLFLEHELDTVLEQQQVRRIVAVEFDAVLVVPLDPADKFSAVRQDDHHRGSTLHLLEVVITFRIGLFSRYLFPTTRGTGRKPVHSLGH